VLVRCSALVCVLGQIFAHGPWLLLTGLTYHLYSLLVVRGGVESNFVGGKRLE
jgi:hypothetical protein